MTERERLMDGLKHCRDVAARRLAGTIDHAADQYALAAIATAADAALAPQSGPEEGLMTVCEQCEHHIDGNVGWFQVHLCAATKHREADATIDPVTGRTVDARDVYQACHVVNDGDCPKYEPRPIRWWQFWRQA
jgi:hypothetical protein